MRLPVSVFLVLVATVPCLGQVDETTTTTLVEETTTSTTLEPSTSTVTTTSTSSTEPLPPPTTTSTSSTVPPTNASTTSTSTTSTSPTPTVRPTSTSTTRPRPPRSTTTTRPPTTSTTSTTIPAPLCVGAADFQRLRLAGGKRGAKLTLRVRLIDLPLAPLDYDPGREGMAVLLVGQSGGVIGSLTLPAGAGCGRADGWRSHPGYTTQTYTYRNATGAVPPACASRSASLVRTGRIEDALARDGTMRVQVKTTRLAPGAAADVVAVTILFGDEPSQAAGACARLTLRCASRGSGRACR